MKKLLFLLLLIIFSSFFIFLWWNSVSRASLPNDSTPRKFLITKGQSAGKVAQRLEDARLIKSELAFRLYTQLTGKEKFIQAGNYELSPNLSLTGIVKVILSGPREIWITYPEGLRREEIAAKTIKALELDTDKAKAFWDEFAEESEGKEGFLFPETYLFPRDITAAKVTRKLRATFEEKVSEKMVEDAKETGLSLDEVVILASIIERETLTKEERPIVAGILLKRLSAGWPLQADATLQYVVTTQKCYSRGTSLSRAESRDGTLDTCGTSGFEWWDTPTNEDKKLKSPFNTYTNRGLPPSPIANPGLSSIKAAIYPQNSSYWYYLHDRDGKIHYAKTIEEHTENINRYLR